MKRIIRKIDRKKGKFYYVDANGYIIEMDPKKKSKTKTKTKTKKK